MADGFAADTVAAAKARGVPVITARQLLTWTDGRNNSSFSDLSWDPATARLTVEVTAAAGSRGMEAMLPLTTEAGALTALSGPSGNLTWREETIKGVTYAFFPASSGGYVATYG